MNQIIATSASAAAPSQQPSASWQYVYGIVPTPELVTFDVSGVDGADDDVYTVPHGDLAAVVSRATRADYRGLTRPQVARSLVAHQRVVEAVMEEFPILPVKFGTVLPSEATVHRLLQQGRNIFASALDRLAGQVQSEIVVLWDTPQVITEIAQEEAIVQLKAQLAAAANDGAASELLAKARLAVGQMVFASLQQRRTAICDRVLPQLRAVASDVAMNPLMDDSMVLNVALLVKAGTAQTAEDGTDLDRLLEALDLEFEGRLTLRCVGPLPPYSFATVEIQLPSFAVIDAARQRLALEEVATAGDIKRAYYRLASQLHPDHNSPGAETEGEMTALSQAYRLLMAYAQSQAASAGPDDDTASTHFSQEAVEQTLLLEIRRQDGADL